MNNRRGLSDIVTTIIIIALSLVAIAVVWVVFQNLIASNSGQIASSENFMQLKLKVESVSNDSGKLFVLLKRDVGQGNFNAIKFVIYYKNKSSENFIKNGSFDELGVKGFLLNNSGDIGSISSVEVYPTIINDAGKPIVSTIYVAYEVNGFLNENNNIAGPTSCSPNKKTISTAWVNISCLLTNFMNQTRNTTTYDENNCGDLNSTVIEYQNSLPCVYSEPKVFGAIFKNNLIFSNPALYNLSYVESLSSNSFFVELAPNRTMSEGELNLFVSTKTLQEWISIANCLFASSLLIPADQLNDYYLVESITNSAWRNMSGLNYVTSAYIQSVPKGQSPSTSCSVAGCWYGGVCGVSKLSILSGPYSNTVKAGCYLSLNKPSWFLSKPVYYPDYQYPDQDYEENYMPYEWWDEGYIPDWNDWENINWSKYHSISYTSSLYPNRQSAYDYDGNIIHPERLPVVNKELSCNFYLVEHVAQAGGLTSASVGNPGTWTGGSWSCNNYGNFRYGHPLVCCSILQTFTNVDAANTAMSLYVPRTAVAEHCPGDSGTDSYSW
jgi:hypothetical protein